MLYPVNKDVTQSIQEAAVDYLGTNRLGTVLLDWANGDNAPADFYPEISAAISKAVDDAFPAPPLITLDARNNQGAGLAIAFGVIATFGSIISLPYGSIFALLGLGFGVWLLYGGFRNWVSPTKYERLAREAQERASLQWQSERAQTTKKLETTLRRNYHRALAGLAGVPERLWPEFIREAAANEGLRRHEWRVDWWVNQPVFPPAPGALAIRIGHDEYEGYCADWLRSLGWMSAKTTRYSRDGGIDIVTTDHVVQCKHYDGGSVGAREVREIFGLATATKKQGVVITSGQFTKDAMTFAKQTGVALIYLDERDGNAKARTQAGVELMAGTGTTE